MSPLLAHGGNCGVESATALANGLVQEINLHHGHKPDKAALRSVFDIYQASRKARVKKVYEAVHRMTRLHTSDSLFKRIFTRLLLPYIFDDAKAATAMMKGAVKVEFLPVLPHCRGTIGFDDEIALGTDEKKAAGSGLQRFPISSFGYIVTSGILFATAVCLRSSLALFSN